MLSANAPTAERHTQSAIMRRYYLLKREKRLDQMTLKDGIALAVALVQATIDLAPAEAGVGGPIDVATVTTSGIKWIQKKANYASLPPAHSRVNDSNFRGTFQTLDNFQCVRCDFTDAHLFYEGLSDVELVDNTFGGSCRLALAPLAETRKPDVVARLKALMDGKCRIVVQNSNYP